MIWREQGRQADQGRAAQSSAERDGEMVRIDVPPSDKTRQPGPPAWGSPRTPVLVPIKLTMNAETVANFSVGRANVLVFSSERQSERSERRRSSAATPCWAASSWTAWL
jgi:hypothetical protein